MRKISPYEEEVHREFPPFNVSSCAWTAKLGRRFCGSVVLADGSEAELSQSSDDGILSVDVSGSPVDDWGSDLGSLWDGESGSLLDGMKNLPAVAWLWTQTDPIIKPYLANLNIFLISMALKCNLL
jgi:hypothetical protein